MIHWLLLLALQYDPNLSPKFSESSRLLQQQRFPEAISILETLTKEKPAVGEYWFALGIAQAASGNSTASLAPLEKACTIPDRVARACYHWGRQLDQAYRGALAESALRPKNSAEIQLRYSAFLIRQGKIEASLWQLDQVIRKQPFFGIAWREKAGLLMAVGRKEDAADALEQAIAHGERNRENLLLLSRLYAELGNKDKAQSYKNEATPQ
ncbi:MAG: tetratricopeptide repeat protein [Acidobacteria bacterium]|nr:tetratricopeptide repeat protein [Acidobacteriota bacterium]